MDASPSVDEYTYVCTKIYTDTMSVYEGERRMRHSQHKVLAYQQDIYFWKKNILSSLDKTSQEGKLQYFI